MFKRNVESKLLAGFKNLKKLSDFYKKIDIPSNIYRKSMHFY